MDNTHENTVIVSRHPAAIEFIAKQIAGYFPYEIREHKLEIFEYLEKEDSHNGDYKGEKFREIPIVKEATESHVDDKIVYGNLPMKLAALAKVVYAVEFELAPPRGNEYTLEDMHEAGVRLNKYKVLSNKLHEPIIVALAHCNQ